MSYLTSVHAHRVAGGPRHYRHPAGLAKTKQQSRRAACLSNLHQVGLACRMYLGEHEDRFPDRRDLKTAFGYKPWSTWPSSDPRGGRAAVVLSNHFGSDDVWLCPAIASPPVRTAPQAAQPSRRVDPASIADCWLWRFDRTDDPVVLDKFWGKTPERAVEDLRLADNPALGQAFSVPDVELVVDPYFPVTVLSLPAETKGRAAHSGGRNALMRYSRTKFIRDARVR